MVVALNRYYARAYVLCITHGHDSSLAFYSGLASSILLEEISSTAS